MSTLLATRLVITWVQCCVSASCLLLTLAAQAQTPEAPQVTTPANPPTTQRFSSRYAQGNPRLSSLLSFDPADDGGLTERLQELLRKELADPERRQQLITERTQQLRTLNSGLGRVVGLNATTIEKLFGLLVEQHLAYQLQPRVENRVDPLEREVRRYDASLLEIANIIGPTRVAAYVDFVQRRPARTQVEQFAARLPDTAKLSARQQEALIPLFAEHSPGPSLLSLGNAFERVRLAAGSDEARFLQIYDIVLQEETARLRQAANLELEQRVARVLSAKQAQLFAEQLREPVDWLLASARQSRQESGLTLEELPNPGIDASPPRRLVANTRLELRLDINDNAVTHTVTTRGDATTLAGPEGSLIELRALPAGKNAVNIELKLYEQSPDGRRFVGTSASDYSTDSEQQSYRSRTQSTTRTVLRGRKGYLLSWNVTATPL